LTCIRIDADTGRKEVETPAMVATLSEMAAPRPSANNTDVATNNSDNYDENK